MMNFPAAPILNQVHEDPVSKRKWVWNGVYWAKLLNENVFLVVDGGSAASTTPNLKVDGGGA